MTFKDVPDGAMFIWQGRVMSKVDAHTAIDVNAMRSIRMDPNAKVETT